MILRLLFFISLVGSSRLVSLIPRVEEQSAHSSQSLVPYCQAIPRCTESLSYGYLTKENRLAPSEYFHCPNINCFGPAYYNPAPGSFYHPHHWYDLDHGITELASEEHNLRKSNAEVLTARPPFTWQRAVKYSESRATSASEPKQSDSRQKHKTPKQSSNGLQAVPVTMASEFIETIAASFPDNSAKITEMSPVGADAVVSRIQDTSQQVKKPRISFRNNQAKQRKMLEWVLLHNDRPRDAGDAKEISSDGESFKTLKHSFITVINPLFPVSKRRTASLDLGEAADARLKELREWLMTSERTTPSEVKRTSEVADSVQSSTPESLE